MSELVIEPGRAEKNYWRDLFRYAFLGKGLFSWGYLGISAGITAAILFLGIILFNHVERTFMDTV